MECWSIGVMEYQSPLRFDATGWNEGKDPILHYSSPATLIGGFLYFDTPAIIHEKILDTDLPL